MSEFRRIMMSSFLMLLLHFTAADVKYYFPTVRVGDEVTLPFDNVIDDQDKCESTEWTFSDSRGSATSVKLVHLQIKKEAKAKPDRLRVTENCSLVIKKVTEEDAGFYSCRQFRSGEQQGPDSSVLLSVVTMTEHQDNDEMTLDCSVTRYIGWCGHSVKWLLQGRDVDKDHRDIKTSQSSCSASVTFLTSLFSYTSRSELFTCEVTDDSMTDVDLFVFSPQSSGEDAGKVTAVSTTWTTVSMRAAGEMTNTSEDNQTEQEDNNKGRLRLIMVSVGLAALIITVVTVNIWTRAKGSKAQTEENMEQNDDDEDEDEVNYENDGGAFASV
ncbi:uncharacterized protein LOC117482518 [Trematomus bernacchii]|uniref:uncharacterized protein LOC117482518 n=1 Tax=Trematomus bernacchii TaxID=40690 RepID=UPI00146B0437|nr:uncharacterized protein LOC117482518 [Trematomus bernacchii]